MGDKGKIAFGTIFVVALFISAVLFAGYIETNENVQALISSFGPLGILVVSFVGGLNLIVPVPATAFIPVFSAAGFSLSLIIFIIVIGTTIADLVAFYVGTVLKPQAEKINSKVLKFLRKHCEHNKRMMQAIVFIYAAIVPFPNEVLLLPLGTLGIKLRSLFLVFTLGNATHVTLLALGLTSI